MKTLKTALSLIMVLCMFLSLGTAAFANSSIPDNPEGKTVAEVKADEWMGTNEGTVTDNNGIISLNADSGVVTNNNAGGHIQWNSGTVTTNAAQDGGTAAGHVEFNENGGTVEHNNGSIYTNQAGGKVVENKGEVTNNAGGTVANNNVGGTVKNNNGGTVENNNAGGTVTNNNAGTVENNTGTVLENNDGTVVNNNNGGKVTNNDGTVINNFGNGKVDPSNPAKNQYSFNVEITTENATASTTPSGDLTLFNNLYWLKDGSTTGGSVTVSPSDGYTLDTSSVDSSPEGLTVETQAGGGLLLTFKKLVSNLKLLITGKANPTPKPDPKPVSAPAVDLSINAVKFTFDLDGGSLKGETGKVIKWYIPGATVKLPAAPTKDGCSFAGWETKVNGEKKVFEAGEKFTVTGAQSFTALWEEA